MKNLKNLGKALSKAEQQTINGGQMAPLPEGSTACHHLEWRELNGHYFPVWTANENCGSVEP